MKILDSISVDRYWDKIENNNECAIGILDISRDIDSYIVQKRTFDMTYFYVNRMIKTNLVSYVGFFHTVDEILEKAVEQKKKYCMVVCQGLLLFRGPTLLQLSLEYAKKIPDFFVVGHIMNKEDRYPGLHRQYLFVNLNTWIKLKKPSFKETGYYWDRSPELQNYKVSNSTIHADYTPLWITKSEGKRRYSHVSDGYSWVDIALENNIRIDNLDSSMRESKIFLYPYLETKKLEEVWYNKQSPTVDTMINFSQKAWIRKLGYQEEIEKDRVYVFNTETLSGEGVRTKAPIDRFFSVAAGFKPLAILSANGFHDRTIVNYFDWCEASLNFKKHLLETWDGIDLHKWLLKHDLKYNFSSTYRGNYKKYWLNELKDFGGPEKFKEVWDRYSKLDHTFNVIDIVNEPEKLFDLVDSAQGTNVLWTTNIWSSEMLHWNVEPEILENKWKKFQNLIPKNLILYGHDYIAIDMQERISKNLEITHPRFFSKFSKR
jgi:phage anti-repressor protein